MKQNKTVITSASLPSVATEEVCVDQLQAPFAKFRNGALLSTNNAYVKLLRSLPTVAQSVPRHPRLLQAIRESMALQLRLTVDIDIEDRVYHCIVTPIEGCPDDTGILFEDVSATAHRDKDNALLYRLSLLFANIDQPLHKTLQMIVDQILFEIDSFDCSILLFNKRDGKLHTVAWGKADNSSGMTGDSKFSLGEGVAGYVAASKKPIVIPNVMQDKRFVKKVSDHDPLALLCVPVLLSRELLGVICVTRNTQRGFSDREVQLFTIISGRLSTLIKLAQDKSREASLNEFSQILSTSRSIFDGYPRIATLLSSIFEANNCLIAHCDKGNALRFVRDENELSFSEKQLSFLRHLATQDEFVNLLHARKPVDLQSAVIAKDEERLRACGLTGAVIFPIIVRGQNDGFVIVNNTAWERMYSPSDLNLGMTIVTQLSVAVENTLYHGEILDEQKKLQQVQETLRDGLILYDKDLNIAMYNTAAKRLLGIKKNIVGLSWSLVLQRKVTEYCANVLERHFDPEVFLELALEQGKTSMGLATISGRHAKTIEITVAPVYDRQDQISGILSHFRDITPIHDLQTKMATRLRQLTNLFKISSVTGFDTQEIVHRILELVLRLLSVQSSQLLLIDPVSETLYEVDTVGDSALFAAHQSMIERRVKRVMQTKRSRISALSKQAGELLVIPVLGHHDEAIGALLVAARENGTPFTKDDTHLLSIVAARIASKLDTAWLLSQVEDDREKLAAIIEQSVDGILVTDPSQNVQIWNSALERMTGIEATEVRGKSLSTIRNQFADMQVYPGADGFSEVHLHNLKTGLPVWLGAAYAPIVSNDETTGYVVILRDISRQKELEQAKNEFVSTASHELRSPITAIVGYLSMLKRGDAGRIINNQQAFFIDKAYSNAKRMVGLIEDLLMTTRMETGQLRYHVEPIDVVQAIEGIVSDLRFKAEEKHITVVIQRTVHAMALADKDGIHQVFTNIVNNAIKYTPNHGTVTIGFTADHKGDHPQLVIAVKDTGVGIDPSDQSRVFDKFARIDNPLSVSAGGTGLGLYITKTIVESLGGKIWLESEKGKGTTFYVSLPLPNKNGKERK